MVGSLRQADAHAEIEFPIRAEIHVDRRQDLLLLFAQRIEPVTGPYLP